MSSKNASMEAALLEIAKDLLQASDDLASTDPSASAKLAHEAYEIGRDLGIVRSHLDGKDRLSAGAASVTDGRQSTGGDSADEHSGLVSARNGYDRHNGEDDSDAELLRILDRQKALLPKPVELAPVRKPSRDTRGLTFESMPPKRSGWLGWMRSREWRHAG
jgi:hypothetical protein